MAWSKVVSTRLNVFDGAPEDIGEVLVTSETRRFLKLSRSAGELERDVVAVHEEVVEDMELWRARCQREKSFLCARSDVEHNNPEVMHQTHP